MNKLIYFRDLVCQGAIDILSSAKNRALQESSCDELICLLKNRRLIFLIKEEKLQDISHSCTAISLWKKVAELLQLEFCIQQEIIDIKKEDILLADREFILPLQEMERENILIEQGNYPDYTMKNALSTFSTLLYTSLLHNKNFYEINIAYIGDGNNDNRYTTNNLINSSICMRNFITFSFSEYAYKKSLALDTEELSFAMNAGAKIFLTHNPEFIESDMDILFLAPWTHEKSMGKDGQQSGLQVISHPYAYENIYNLFLDNTQIVSLTEDFKSSEINLDFYMKAAITTRIASLQYMLNKKGI